MIDIVWASLVAQQVKNLPAMQETGRYSLGQNISLHLNVSVYLYGLTSDPHVSS